MATTAMRVKKEEFIICTLLHRDQILIKTMYPSPSLMYWVDALDSYPYGHIDYMK